ncbi:hypothetical protein BJX64DRAFT_294007 [Aspergillus heterothallicus]
MTDQEDSTQEQPVATAATWNAILTSPTTKSFVLFHHGTCVILTSPVPDSSSSLEDQAIALLKEYGPVHVATPSADFNILDLDEIHDDDDDDEDGDSGGWTGPGGDAVEEGKPSMVAGLIGRGNRERDAMGLRVVHVQDNRGKS